MSDTNPNYSIHSVTSHDGTKIGYRQMGRGPGLILLHGGMSSSQNFMTLADILSEDFTVYIPDRRGRGLSGTFGDGYCIQKEIEDLNAIIRETDTHNIFGLSSGALIALKTSLYSDSIHKLAVYEPDFATDHSIIEKHNVFMQRFEEEIVKGEFGAAFVTITRGLDIIPSIFKYLPRFMLVIFFNHAIKRDSENIKEDEVPLVELIPTQHFDYQLLIESEGSIDDLNAISSQVLLLGGSKSPVFFKRSLGKINNMLVCVKRIEFRGLGHTAPMDNNQPELVAEELRKFFISYKCKQK